GGLHLAPLAAQHDLVRRGVVLQFVARCEVVLPRRHCRRLPDAMTAAEGRQRLIGERRSWAASSSCTRIRFPLQSFHSSRICCRYGSAFSGRDSVGTCNEFDCRTLRTVNRESFSTRAISCLLTPFA